MKIVTSLSFQGQCHEAFTFYAKVLGGKITAAFPYGEAPPGMPIAAPNPATPAMAIARYRPRDDSPHRTIRKTTTPMQLTAPPNPARSWAMRGTSRGLSDERSAAVTPM